MTVASAKTAILAKASLSMDCNYDCKLFSKLKRNLFS
jgi:hypothetical protein